MIHIDVYFSPVVASKNIFGKCTKLKIMENVCAVFTAGSMEEDFHAIL